MQKAAVRACRNAIEFNSIPCIQQIVPNGYAGMQIHVKIGVPDPVRRSPCFSIKAAFLSHVFIASFHPTRTVEGVQEVPCARNSRRGQGQIDVQGRER
jgi:hypothetical protein